MVVAAADSWPEILKIQLLRRWRANAMYTDIDEEKNHEARLRVVYRQKGKRYKEILLKDVLAPPLLKTAQAGWLAFSRCDLTMGLFFKTGYQYQQPPW